MAHKAACVCKETGRPLAVKPYEMTEADWTRFWAAVAKDGRGGCWRWLNPQFLLNLQCRRTVNPTRIVLDFLLKKPGWRVHRKTCRNIRCCNPEHLELEELAPPDPR